MTPSTATPTTAAAAAAAATAGTLTILGVWRRVAAAGPGGEVKGLFVCTCWVADFGEFI